MSVRRIDITLPAVGSQPVQVDSERHGVRQMILVGDEDNLNAFYVGDSTMATDGSEGVPVGFSTTDPPALSIGPFNAGAPVNSDEIFVVGTATQIVHVFLATH